MPDEQTHAAPARITLDDLIESVTRGVRRAMEAEGEVSGYGLPGQPAPPNPLLQGGRWPGGPIIIGIIYNPNLGGGGTFTLPQ